MAAVQGIVGHGDDEQAAAEVPFCMCCPSMVLWSSQGVRSEEAHRVGCLWSLHDRSTVILSESSAPFRLRPRQEPHSDRIRGFIYESSCLRNSRFR